MRTNDPPPTSFIHHIMQRKKLMGSSDNWMTQFFAARKHLQLVG